MALMTLLRPMLLLVLSVCAGLAGCADGAKQPPNVLLITLDTLRADHLGCYGYDKPTSPNIDRFAARATRFERALATAPWTIPTHASLFTGLHPYEHEAHSFDVRMPAFNVYPLPSEHKTLAEALRSEGYATAGIVANSAYLSSQSNIDQGFDMWDAQHRKAPEINARAFAWLDEHKERPFFLGASGSRVGG